MPDKRVIGFLRLMTSCKGPSGKKKKKRRQGRVAKSPTPCAWSILCMKNVDGFTQLGYTSTLN